MIILIKSVNSATIRLGKRNALYIPKGFVDKLGIQPGDRIQITLEDRAMRMEVLEDPLRLALEGEKFASISADEIESISLREQRKYVGNSP